MFKILIVKLKSLSSIIIKFKENYINIKFYTEHHFLIIFVYIHCLVTTMFSYFNIHNLLYYRN